MALGSSLHSFDGKPLSVVAAIQVDSCTCSIRMKEVPRFELQHPQDPSVQVAYGLDCAIGFFAAIDFGQCQSPQTKNRALVEYDALQEGYSQEFPLRGCLEFLAEHGLFSIDELNESIVWFDLHGDRLPPKRLRLAVMVVADMRKAAD